MRHWSIGVALATVWMTAAVAVQAQYLPGPGQPAAVAEPLPFAPPSAIAGPPGAGMPQASPGYPGGDGDGSVPPPLPPNLPNAWLKTPGEDMPSTYVYAGALWLQRQRMGNGALIALDPSNLDNTGTVPTSAPLVANFNDMSPHMQPGVRATVGYHWDCSAFEVSGFYISQTKDGRNYADQGRLDLFFINTPVGFEGNNNLWLNADLAAIELETRAFSGEANYRWWLGAYSNFSWLIGVRYFDYTEHLGIVTDDEGLSVVGTNGQSDPTRRAEYAVRTHNRIVAPQLGCEWNKPLTHFLAMSCTWRGAWGVNFVNDTHLLRRGDGLIGIANTRSDTNFSHVYEMGAYLDWRLSIRSRVRTGYNALWLVDVTEAADQVDFDLSNPTGPKRDQGSVFFHGPVVELQVIF